MLSLKNTTMSWFKGGNKAQNISKKRDITTTSTVIEEEQVSNELALIPHRVGNSDFSTMERESESPRTRLYTPTSTSHSRVTSPTLMDASPLVIEASTLPSHISVRKQYEDTEGYILTTSQEDDTDTIHANGRIDDRTAELSSSGNGKKKGVKLRIAALNMLKMKSSTFLRKPIDGEEQQQGISRRRDSVDPFPSITERTTLTRSNTATGTPTTQPRRRTGRLTKPPPPELLQNRRSAVVESIQEDNPDPVEPRASNWGTVANRPPSSQSSHPGGPNRGDDGTSLAADPNTVTAGNVPGGLCPRPSSLKRHWSDGPHSKRDSLTQLGPTGTPQRAATEGSDRVRPLSFNNMLNTYGSMKITEAATLESRLRDLETQVASLQAYVTTQVTSTEVQRRPSSRSSQLSHKSSRLTDKSAQTSPALGPPFSEDMALSKRPDTAQSTHTTSSYMNGHESEYSAAPESSTTGAPSKASASIIDWRSGSRGGVPLSPSPSPYEDGSVSSFISDETVNIRNRPYRGFDNAPGPSTEASKRNTVASSETITLRNHNREYEMDYHREREREMQVPLVTMTDYNNLVRLLKREHRARRRLEGQVQILQEQMAHVLHRQLLQADPIYSFGRSPTITGRSQATMSAASTQRPEHMNGRRTSSEVPTPDQTPPRGRHDLSRASSHFFNGFDSAASASDIDDDRGSYYDDDNENWQTPAEDARSLSQINGHFAPPLPLGTQKRTMSISQITEKASLASTRAGR